ncbi:hypothetical protein, partial [Streptomyces sp. NPDC050164]|uniref:hypothetical protein n=1 Tax=Streptomyces sp. NPDC050164 TaxID=3365605 RepID=UPI00378A169D
MRATVSRSNRERKPWNQRWPGDPKTFKNVSPWELRPSKADPRQPCGADLRDGLAAELLLKISPALTVYAELSRLFGWQLYDLGVLIGQVGDAAGWGLAADAGVGSVVVVPVQ